MAEGIRPIVMPRWGLAMTEGTVVAWHVAEGSEITPGDDLLDIETTKITNVFESPVDGPLRRVVVPEGAVAPVGALLGVAADPEVSDTAVDAFIAEFAESFDAAAAEAEAAVPEPQTLDVAGVPIAYLRMGPEDGTSIVLIHGFGGDLNNWLFTQPVLAERHDVIAVDLPGHGRSGKDVGTGDMAALATSLGGLLDGLGVERPHIVGHSMGGALGLVFALANPQRVAGLTLLAPGGLGPEINMDYIEGFIGAGKRKEMKTALQLLVADAELISRDMVNDVLKYKRLDGVEAGLRRLADGLFPDGRQQTLDGGALGGLGMPIVVAWGEADQILPVGHADALPGSAKVERLSGIGHLPHMEAAAEVNRLIEETLE
ncbi:MAG: acetoin dehydrogenase dihydrolipoyllysine-residue acetyltransferase subunit [Kiloniellales bacterium]|nr:acetoin dehydrogenase dihydrolipoyllysine-residue acetyltransferase subunit [Kiloniellales bacterium]